MHVNNETGVVQPLSSICEVLKSHPAYLHVDAAQGFGKEVKALADARIDLISVSGHKIYGAQGKWRSSRASSWTRSPSAYSTFFWRWAGARFLRPGTLPVPLIAGFGLAAELSHRQNTSSVPPPVERSG